MQTTCDFLIAPILARLMRDQFVEDSADAIGKNCNPRHPETYADGFVLSVDGSHVDQQVSYESAGDQSVSQQDRKLKKKKEGITA